MNKERPIIHKIFLSLWAGSVLAWLVWSFSLFCAQSLAGISTSDLIASIIKLIEGVNHLNGSEWLPNHALK